MLRRGGKVRRQHEDIKSTNTEGGGRYHVTVLSAQSGGASRTGTGGRLQTGNMSAVPLWELCVVNILGLSDVWLPPCYTTWVGPSGVPITYWKIILRYLLLLFGRLRFLQPYRLG